MKYPDFEEAVEMCRKAGKNCHLGRSDISMAFRNVPLMVQDFCLMVLKAVHPITGETFYFVDKDLPFGSSISCAIFQSVSNGVAHIVKFKTNKPMVNYLDDYLVVALKKVWCDWQLQYFLDTCEQIGLPVVFEKTFWGSTILTLLGMLLDAERQVVCVPRDKVVKALDMIEFFLNRVNKKATVYQIQKLYGFLNFLCKCIVPGRAFLRRTYSLASRKLKAYHHVRINAETRMDLQVWKVFLSHPGIFCRPFMEFGILKADEINMYSDTSGSHRKGGFGALFEDRWCYGKWDSEFMDRENPSIAYLELFGIAVAILKWIKMLKNRRVILFTDNESAKNMLNFSTSGCKNCMVLIRIITLECLIWNVRVYGKYVESKNSGLADSLPWMDFPRFRRLGPHMRKDSEEIPDQIWPLDKIWMK